ncbi:MAG TPA: hypothetical protein VN704_06665 [Verrucomicrobiae bacterium]|nr:hypothetical protein [Verrucomicrobiae bacterium]
MSLILIIFILIVILAAVLLAAGYFIKYRNVETSESGEKIKNNEKPYSEGAAHWKASIHERFNQY